MRRYAALMYRPWIGSMEVWGQVLEQRPGDTKSSGFMEVFDTMEAAVEAYPNAELVVVETREREVGQRWTEKSRK